MNANDVIAAVHSAVRKYPAARRLTSVKDAQSEASKAANAASRILLRDLPLLSSDDRKAVLFEALREIDRAALEAAAKMQRTRAAAYGEENLGIADTRFDAERARHLVTYAETLYADGEGDDGELSESQQAALKETIENNARLCVDDAEHDLADARYNMGFHATIERSAIGKNSCEWCLSAAGEYEYGPTMDKGLAFGRHANCDCLIEYHPGSGRVETVRNYRMADKDKQRLLNQE